MSGDGCSAQCQPDDDVRTPGDDRVGYFFCPSEEGSTGISCPPDTLCCVTFGPLCASHEQGCSDPLNMITCDGPEDCGGSTPCRKQPHGTQCSTIDLGSDRCHRDSDCGVFEGVQLSCGALGDCEYPTPPLLGR